ncbi:hypothetical protein [Rhizobium bangladeshense]|uniref:hypothetical protein n=1 Tax=Rhizobium bangladeshense TaxID=1138189 RepID=UPI000AEDA26F|nr:hypothetical protein [Rhizobium bangladeshense]
MALSILMTYRGVRTSTDAVNVRLARGAVERHDLVPADGNHHVLESLAAPAEPHEFEGELLLARSVDSERFPFTMLEAERHHH